MAWRTRHQSAVEFSGRNLHPLLGNRRSSGSDLPATDDDEDDIFEARIAPRRRRYSFQAYSFSTDYFTVKYGTPTEKANGPILKEDRMISRPVKFQSNSATEHSERSSQNKHRKLSRESRPIVSDLPQESDEEDEVFEDIPVYFPSGGRQGRFEATSGSAEYSTLPKSGSLPAQPGHATSSSPPGGNEMNQSGMQGGNMLQVPSMTRHRSGSTGEIPEQFAENMHPKLGQRRSSESDLAGKEEEMVLDYLPYGRRRRSCQVSSGDYFIHRSGKLTENAKKLSQEEIHSLEIDIFKPLDFYEILFERMKITDNKTQAGPS